MSAVRDEEQLRREGAEALTADEIVGRTPWQLFWVRFKRDRVAFAALAFIVLLVLLAAFAGVITSAFGHPPNAQYPNALDPLFGTPTGPSSKFLFGVDRRPRRLLARALRSARLAGGGVHRDRVSVGIGVVLGMVAGYFRGWVDTAISRLIDITLAFPILLLALGIASACSLGNGCAGGLIKPGLATVIVVIVVVNWTYIGRIIRGQVLSLREKEFIEAARALAAPRTARSSSATSCPNLVAPIIVYSTLIIPHEHPVRGGAVVPRRRRAAAEGELGRDDRRVDAIYNTAWWYFAFPGVALLLTVLAFNLLGDGVQDALNPRTNAHEGGRQ